MMPTPAPAPPMPMQAIPAPMYFAVIGSMKRTPSWGLVRQANSVARMDSIVDVDAGEDGEDVGLQERDQQFKRGQRHGQSQRQDGPDPAHAAKCSQHGDEACEYLQPAVAVPPVRDTAPPVA